jgi:hypothetical protein
MSHFAHEIGLVGETMNFIGAVVLAMDLFQRPRERRNLRSLQQLRDFGQKFALKSTRYGGIGICSDDFHDVVSDRRTLALAWVGAGMMALGFLCLILYHWLEMA